ncbi:hypothetical protein SLEP1_g52375 [Rubroshorea leprosula]|uniref:Uncharacterized protein n=1 Tax=Rubroshorea leprosula TaxID=152421 RepID=A0AAV5M9T3_9ROSI|nr:hypothetical protein SLEP1_g52375 [Rubroshorea leprosula]
MDSLYFSLEVDDKEFSACDNDDDEEFQNDLQALKQACLKTGPNPDDCEINAADCNSPPVPVSASASTASANQLGLDSESDDEDLELFRSRRSRLATSDVVCDPLFPPITSDCNEDDAEDDFETLRAIQRRFSAYTASESRISSDKSENSTFPKSAKMFIDAIKSNRSFQKLLRSKLTQIEAKIEKNKQLRERLKILKNFDISCKKRTTRALSLGKDPRIQFISTRKSKASGKHCYGPPENPQVPDYRMALTKLPLSLELKKWSKEERENLIKGIKQQFQEKVLYGSVDSWRDGNNLDNIIASIKDIEITPERIREFVAQVNWDQLALMLKSTTNSNDFFSRHLLLTSSVGGGSPLFGLPCSHSGGRKLGSSSSFSNSNRPFSA